MSAPHVTVDSLAEDVGNVAELLRVLHVLLPERIDGELVQFISDLRSNKMALEFVASAVNNPSPEQAQSQTQPPRQWR